MTTCHDHVETNTKEHSTLHHCTDWADRAKPQPEEQHFHQKDVDNPSYDTMCQHSILQEWSNNKEGN